jgi:hypothetical protein
MCRGGEATGGADEHSPSTAGIHRWEVQMSIRLRRREFIAGRRGGMPRRAPTDGPNGGVADMLDEAK